MKNSMYCEGNVNISNDWKSGLQEVLDSNPVIILIIFFSNWKLILISVDILQNMRAVWKVSIHSEYLKNWLCGLDVTWQPVRGDLTVHPRTVNLPCGLSVGSETPLTELVYCVTAAFTMTERADQLHHNNVPAHSISLVQALFFFGKASHHPGLSAPLQPRFGSLWLLAFPKAKITTEREEICECDGHTEHKLSQRCLTADWLASWDSVHGCTVRSPLAAKLHQGQVTGSRDIKNGQILSGQPLYNTILHHWVKVSKINHLEPSHTVKMVHRSNCVTGTAHFWQYLFNKMFLVHTFV